MAEHIHAAVSSSPLSCDNAIGFVDAPSHGAACVFVGKVRDHNFGRKVTAVSYDVFESLAISVFEDIAMEAAGRWKGGMKIWIEHYRGRLDIGGASVVIAVSSPHRDESFQACRYIIEAIKRRAPIWKQEHYVDGESEWVKGHSLCKERTSFFDCDDPSVPDTISKTG